MLLASITTFLDQHDQWALVLLFVLLALESFGLPVPGETALIACGVLASQGSLSIVWVIVVAILAAIIGDNLGYWAAREGGRPLLERHRLTRRYAQHYLPRGERFFAKHGATECKVLPEASAPSMVARPSSSAASWRCYG